MLQRIVDDLNKDPMVRQRIELSRKLFSDPKFHHDSRDLMLLTKESLMAGFFDKYVKQLLLIRKGQDAYVDYSARKLNQLVTRPVELTASGASADDDDQWFKGDDGKWFNVGLGKWFDGGGPSLDVQLAELGELIRNIHATEGREFTLLTKQDRDALKTLKARAVLTAEEKEMLEELEELAEKEKKAAAEPTANELRLKHLLEELKVVVKVEINRDTRTEKTRELVTTALNDPNFKLFKDNAERKVAEILYGADADGYQTELAAKPDSAPWGMRHLIQHLLWHCALVNQLYRKIKSRGPMDLTVGPFVEELD